MRLIGTLLNENQARRFCAYLEVEKIDHSCEMTFDPATGHMSYPIWVKDEDLIDKAAALFSQFQSNPADPIYDVAPPPPENPVEEAKEEPQVIAKKRTPVTVFFLFVCSMVFALNMMQGQGLPDLVSRPVEKLLFFDFPPAREVLEQLVIDYKLTPATDLQELPAQEQQKIQEASDLPYWRGAYDLLQLKVEGKDSAIAKGPMFAQIIHGEVWRLFSPCILHRDLLHILFNMIWLWVLCRPVEERIGALRTIALTLILGISSNVAQYLASGPFFMGYSGVVTGLAGFIWMREKIAPWEGYPISRATLLFLVLFVLAMLALQIGSFILLMVTQMNFTPTIANTAHIFGALLGAFLARFSYFDARPVR